MKTITFTINGNQKEPTGNPVPKLKMTGRQSWTDKAQDYVAWKDFVVVNLFNVLEAKKDFDTINICEDRMVKFGHPIALAKDEHAILYCDFYWANEKHGDPENCLGSIADALFFNDKNVDVTTRSQMAPKKQGKVDVRIKIFNK